MTEATPTPAKPKPVKRKFVLVRYGRMNNLGLFEHNEGPGPADADPRRRQDGQGSGTRPLWSGN